MTIIPVTAEHIKRGVWGNSFGCPVALALMDANPRSYPICVGATYATGYAKDIRDMVTFSRDIRLRIREYDMTHEMEPFEMEYDSEKEQLTLHEPEPILLFTLPSHIMETV